MTSLPRLSSIRHPGVCDQGRDARDLQPPRSNGPRHEPDLIIDDGSDVVATMVKERPELIR